MTTVECFKKDQVLIMIIVFWDVISYSVVSTHQIKQIRDTSKEDFVLIIIQHGIS